MLADSPGGLGVAQSWADLAEGGPPSPVILVNASGARKLGGKLIAARMQAGVFPAELP